MSDFLFGHETSGTPLETRDLAGDVSAGFQDVIGGGDSGRLGAQGIADQFGLDLSQLGLGNVASSLLRASDPTARLQEFDRVNRPAQQRAITGANSQLRTSFGAAGSRFSRNLLGAQAGSTARLEQGFDQARFEAFNSAGNQQMQTLLGILGAIPGLQQSSLAPLIAAGQFASPGAPGFQEGAIGDILGAGANIFSTLKFPGPPAATG